MLAERLGAYTGVLQARRYAEEHGDEAQPQRTTSSPQARNERTVVSDDVMLSTIAADWIDHHKE